MGWNATSRAFAVLDHYGDIGTLPNTPEGLFRDTRYLSRFQRLFDDARPLLLGSIIQDDIAALTVDLANSDIHQADGKLLYRDFIAIDRTKFLWQGCCYERIGRRVG